MRTKHKWWMMPTAVVAAVAVAAGGAALWRLSNVRSILRAAVPAQPESGAFSPALAQRVAAAEQRVSTGPQRVAALGELARLLHANGFLAEAGQCYQALLRLEPKNPRWPYLLATILAGYGQLNEALPLLERTVALAPDYAPARVQLGEVLLKLDRAEDAARAFSATLALGPIDTFALLGLARCAIERDDWSQARIQLERIVRAQPEFGPAWHLLATVYRSLGQDRDADAARARDPRNHAEPPDPWVEELMAECFDPYRLTVAAAAATNGGDLRRAVHLLEQARELQPDDGQILLQLGKARAQLGDAAAARRHLERCVVLLPENEEAWSALTTLLAAAGDLPAAERALAAGLARCPRPAGLHLLNGHRLLEAGQIEEAAAEFRASIGFRPKETDAYVSLAEALFVLERPDEAMASLQGALEVEPAHPHALVELARHAIRSADAEAAQKWLNDIAKQPRVNPGEVARLREAFRREFGRTPQR